MDSATYDTVLFIHLLGVGILIVAVGVELFGSLAMLRARTVGELRAATWTMPLTGKLHPLAAAVFAGAGIYLATQADEFSVSSPWVITAIVVTALFTVLGGAYVGRHAEELHKAAVAAPDGPLPADLAARASDPAWHTTFRVLATFIAAFLYLMSRKPDALGCVLLAVVSVAVGLALSVPVWRAARARVGVEVAAPAAS